MATALALDRVFSSGARTSRALEKALGKKGAALKKYAAIGAAYPIALPRREPEARDVTGGDISAGVPAM